jgi:phosphotriesterase-related protein
MNNFKGCILEFDQFGWGCSYTHALQYQITYPSDFERAKSIKMLIDEGYGNQVY